MLARHARTPRAAAACRHRPRGRSSRPGRARRRRRGGRRGRAARRRRRRTAERRPQRCPTPAAARRPRCARPAGSARRRRGARTRRWPAAGSAAHSEKRTRTSSERELMLRCTRARLQAGQRRGGLVRVIPVRVHEALRGDSTRRKRELCACGREQSACRIAAPYRVVQIEQQRGAALICRGRQPVQLPDLRACARGARQRHAHACAIHGASVACAAGKRVPRLRS
jgi:hypothetical protein